MERSRSKPKSGPDPSPIGTKMSGYSEAGPFRCGNCEWFKNGYCGHPVVKTDPQVEHEGSRAEVSPDGCCTYFRKNETL